MNSPRVVSLVPSSTETLLALGADVVACSRFCEQPQLRHVGGTKNPTIGEMVELAPDVVVLDREENRIEDHDALVAAGLTVFVSDVTTVVAGMQVVTDLAEAIGVSVDGVDELRSPVAGPRRTAVVPIWRRPWMLIGPNTYGASLLDHLGIDLVSVGDDPYPTVELADLADRRPGLILVPSEPYEFTDAHLGELRAAVPDARVIRVDGHDLFWWGIRTAGAIERLNRVLAD